MKNNIRRFKNPVKINIGIVFFAIIFLYGCYISIAFFTSKHIIGYEVKNGSLSVTSVYEGIAIRDEKIVKSTNSGYVNYYAREGEKVGAGNAVCSIDETGQLQDIIAKKSAEGENTLDKHDLMELKNDVMDFSGNFSSYNFETAYDFKYSMEGSVLKYSNRNLLSNLSYLNQQNDSGLITLCNAPSSGIVVYSIDDFETRQVSEVNAEWFKKENYVRTPLINNAIVAPGDNLYKLTDNENWCILIEVTPERAKELIEKEYVRVKFLKNQYESWGEVKAVTGTDEGTYLALYFTNSMITFAADRFIDIELITDRETGLKVPNSAIIDKEFFLIPESYLSKTKNNEDCVLLETFDEKGRAATEELIITVYNYENKEYYIDQEKLKKGDQIRKPDSNATYTISKTAALTGVYNINKGYADFKQIQILNSNEEYSIIKSNTMYGLVSYDYIVLDAESVQKDEFIYE